MHPLQDIYTLYDLWRGLSSQQGSSDPNSALPDAVKVFNLILKPCS